MHKWITCEFGSDVLAIDANSVIAIRKNTDALTLNFWLNGANKDFLMQYESIDELNKSYDKFLALVKK